MNLRVFYRRPKNKQPQAGRGRGHPLIIQIKQGLVALMLSGIWLSRSMSAQEITQNGSIHILYEDDGNAVAGAVFQFVPIGKIVQMTMPAGDEEKPIYAATNTGLHFQALLPGLDLTVLESGDGISTLAEAQKMAVECEKVFTEQMDAAFDADPEDSELEVRGYEGVTDDSGILEIKEAAPYLYLVREIQPAVGYQACVPFLISVPEMGSSGWEYAVRAEPKPEMAKEPETAALTEAGKDSGKSENGSVSNNSGSDGTSSGASGVTQLSGRSDNVKTGDAGIPEVWALLLLLSGTVMAGLLQKRCNRCHEK